MKNLKIIAFLFIYLISKDVFAKTAGAYYGINLIRSDIEAGNYVDNTGISLNNSVSRSISDEEQYSLGLNYKVAFNLFGFFVAPGAFYDFSNVSEYDNTGQEWELNARYGLRVDGGYDLTDSLAGYAFTGYAGNYLSLSNSAGSSSTIEAEPFYGAGVKYTVIDNVDLSFEYETSRYRLGVSSSSNNLRLDQEFNIQVMRLGVNFRY